MLARWLPRAWSSHRHKHFLLLGVLASSSVLLLALLFYSNYAGELREKEREGLETLVEMRRDKISALLDERIGDALIVSRNAAVGQLLEAAPGSAARRQAELSLLALAANQYEAYGYRRIQVFNQALIPQLDVGETYTEAELAKVRSVMEDSRYRLFNHLTDSEASSENLSHIKVIYPVVPGRSSDGGAIGAVLLDFGTDRTLVDFIQSLDNPYNSTRLSLFGKSTGPETTAYTSGTGKGDGLLVPLEMGSENAAEFMAEVWRNVGRPFTTRDERGHEVMVSVEQVPELDLLLVGQIDSDEIEGPLRLLAWAGMLSGLLAIVLLVVGYLFYKRREQAEALKQEAHLSRRYIESIRGMMEGFIRLDEDGVIVEFNEAALALTGYSRGGLEALPVALLGFDEAEQALLLHTIKRLPDTRSERFISTWRKLSGGKAIVEGVATYVANAEGFDIFLTVRDVTQMQADRRRLERLNNLHRYLEHVHREIAGKSDPDDILSLACDGMSLDSNILLTWSGKVTRTGEHAGHLDVLAATGPAKGYVNRLRIAFDPSQSGPSGPVAIAIQQDRIVVRRGYEEYKDDPMNSHWSARAKEFKLNSQIVIPLRVENEVYAILTYYSDLDEYFDQEVQSLLVQMADAISAALGAAISRKATERAERALEDRIKLYGAVAESTLESIALIDTESGNFVEFNTQAHERLGYTREEFSKIKVWDLLHDFPDEKTAKDVHRSFEGKNRQVRRHPIHKDGSVREIEVNVSEITVDNRNYLAAIWYDVTDEAKAERASAAEAEKHRVLFEESNIGILVANAEGTIIDGNASVMNLLRTTGDEFIGSEIWRWGRRFSDVEGWREFCRGIVDSGMGIEAETTLLRADGTEIEVDRTWNAATVQGEQVFYCSMRDITERKAIEKELEKHRYNLEALVKERSHDLVETAERLEASEQRYAYAAEATSDGIWDWSARTGQLTVNASYAGMLGYSMEALPKSVEALRELVHPEDVELFMEPWSKATKGGHESEFRMRGADGAYRWILNRCKAVECSRSGSPLRIVGTHTDITRRKEVEELLLQAKDAAEAADRAKSRFLAVVSHEFRTPLNGVIGMTEVLLGEKMQQNQFEMVQIIRDSGLNLMGLIDDILDFSKIEAGRLELDFGPTSIQQVVEGVCDAVAPSAATTGVDLSVFVSPEIPGMVMSDSGRMRQILLNIVGNAVKFSGDRPDRRGMVGIAVEWLAQGQVRITVRDNGVGMSDDIKSKLFTPFLQGDAPASRRFGGTGLGLAISKRLTTLLGGTIEVESEPGAGSTFILEFPTKELGGYSTAHTQPLAGVNCVLLGKAGALETLAVTEHLRHGGGTVVEAANRGQAEKILARLDEPALVVEIADTPATPFPSGASARETAWLILRRDGRWTAYGQGEALRDGMQLGWLRGDAVIRAAAACVGRIEWAEAGNVVDPTGVPALPDPPSIEEARERNELILVADDDEINRNVISRQLKRIGLACEIAKDGEEALRMWQSGKYAMVLTDFRMPGLDGQELAAAIRATEERGKHTPIVILSASAQGLNMENREIDGVDGYLVKPVQLYDLYTTVQTLLRSATQLAEAPEAGAMRKTAQEASVVDFDPTRLGTLIGNDEDFIRTFLHNYMKISRQTVSEIGQSIKAGDIATAGHLAHKLKASSLSSGAMRLGEICSRIEKDAGAGEAAPLAQTNSELQAAFADCQVQISDFLEKVSPA